MALIALLQCAALAIMAFTENGFTAELAFVLTWGILNFFWLGLLRRPASAAMLSLLMIVLLILVSRLKFDVVWMTANFLDVMIIDTGTVSFLLAMMPGLYRDSLIVLAVVLPVLALLWRFDPYRARLRTALVGFAACLAGIVALSFAQPQEGWEAFFGDGYVSKFVRSGVEAVSTLMTQGFMQSDAAVPGQFKLLPAAACAPAGKPPHILLVHDESSFDVRMAPGIKVPDGYGSHFLSFDGKARRFVVEGAGGPSWYTDYNVLAGLSARTFGRFSYYVTQIAAGRVERGLPNALRRCGYHTMTIYPALGAFMSARSFQTTQGVESFFDERDLGTDEVEPDQFYYDAARRMIASERGKGPLFLYVYLGQNHFPWTYRRRPDLLPDWKDPGNTPIVDEYLRRQALSARDYADLLDRLKRDFPDESFLLVRYGDHQPDFASFILEPGLDDAGIRQRLMSYDPRYFTTYYAIDAVNFKPGDVSSALDTIEEALSCRLITQEAARDFRSIRPSSSRKRFLERCNGQFYACAGGAEARRFNRLLIDAGLIKGL